LANEIRPQLQLSMLETNDALFVGANAGEWGGGLRRIDRNNGQIVSVDRRSSTEICSGPLNTNCDPVNGIAAEPWKTNCVAVAIGLVHFMTSGRIVEVCGDDVQSLYEKPYVSEDEGPQDGSETHDTVPFFGMVGSGGVLWTAGLDGIYRIDVTGVTRVSPLPKFKHADGIAVSFDVPHLVVVLSHISGKASVSGAEPMLVSR
jgi:hypothetical protein